MAIKGHPDRVPPSLFEADTLTGCSPEFRPYVLLPVKSSNPSIALKGHPVRVSFFYLSNPASR